MEWSTKSIFCALLFLFLVFSVKTEAPAATTITVTPVAYFIEIFTKQEHFEDAGTKELTFRGKVSVQFNSNATLPDSEFKIELNAQSKTVINSLKLKELKGQDIKNVKYEKIVDKLVITCPKEAKGVKEFLLEVDYTNPFGDDMTGFYRSSYKNDAGKTIWLLTTHFEPIFARKAFPCFDRPDLKALFKIHITVPKEIKTVLSNTALESPKTFSEEAGETVTFKFKPTDTPMSTYLVAFTASNLKASEPVKFNSEYLVEKYSGERSLTTYGREEIIKRKEAALAQNIGKKALTELTKYLGIGYAFEKVDQVGIPDFSAGAMENWGHISFREKSLFFNENNSTASTHQANILTITHELVHQWFGNLVTLESWNYIWLNEAFANYIEYIIANKFEETKDWDLMKQLVVNEIHLRAFETDGLASSKPLNNEITNEALIYSSFNDIPYSKGAAVLRMWNLQLPNNGFQESLKKYIADRKTSTANPKLLFDAFKAKTKLEEDNFNSWITQAGYPVVQVKKTNGTYILTQNRFLWDVSNITSSYVIPITYFTNGSTKFDTVPSLWLKRDPISITSKSKWIIVNNEQAGYYRVNYDKENWNALSSALLEKNYANIPELNRAQLINDAFSLSRSIQKEYIDYGIPLTLIGYLKNETSFVAWKTALNSLDFLQTKLFDANNYGKFKDYISSLVKPHFQTLKTEKLKHIEILKTVEISRWACRLDLDSCVKEAEALYKNETYDQFPDTREIVLCTVVRKNKDAWDKVFKKYKEESDSALKVMYISALGCTSEEKIVKKFLSDTLEDKSDIRKQDLTFVLSSVYNGNLKNVETAFKFIEEKFKEIANKYGGINPLGKALVGIARKLKSDGQLKRLQTLTDKIRNIPELSSAAESISDAINIATNNVKWVEKRMMQIDKYLNSGSLLSYSFGLLVFCIISVFQFSYF